MHKITTTVGTGDMSHGHKHKYVQPEIAVIELWGASAILAGSDPSNRLNTSGWTTTDPTGGSGIIEEDPDNPYGDDDF